MRTHKKYALTLTTNAKRSAAKRPYCSQRPEEVRCKWAARRNRKIRMGNTVRLREPAVPIPAHGKLFSIDEVLLLRRSSISRRLSTKCKTPAAMPGFNFESKSHLSPFRTRPFAQAFHVENLAHHQTHALGANDRRGPVAAGSLGEIDHPDATDQVLERNIAYRGKHTAIGGVVPVVAQHEEVTGRHRVDVGIVVESPLDAIERFMGRAVGKRFPPTPHPGGSTGAAGVPDEILQRLAFHGDVIDVEPTLLHLNAIARQSHHALDVVRHAILRRTKGNHVAARRLGAEDTSRQPRQIWE